MFIPKHFDVSEQKEIFAFIEANAFGQLISNVGGRLFSTHIPFFLSKDKTKLVAHLATQNPQIQGIEKQEVLVTLQGEHGYVSPSWYIGSGVPTWNYQAVHIYGKCEAFDAPNKLKLVVDSLTKKYESNFSNPWQPEYSYSMLEAIVGIEISINEIQCKYKLSQNRSAQDRENVIVKLRANGSEELAKTMQDNEL